MPPWSMQLAVDRIFGPKTDAAVREYQKLHNLKADGIVRPVDARRSQYPAIPHERETLSGGSG